MADGKNRTIKIKTIYAVLGVLCLGIVMIALNVYQLYHLPWEHALTGLAMPKPKVAWIFSKQVYHLNHVMNVFGRLGYTTVHATSPPMEWDVMWSFEYPFRKEMSHMLKNLNKYQMVNHVPGSGFITLKVELATSKLKWIPKAFQIPKEKSALMTEAKLNRNNLWVQKSNDHRGIKIVSMNDLDFKAEGSFVQLYISNPLLIDKRKFDIGVYAVVTSVNPLRVYHYEEEILIRFCQTDYEPLDVNDLTKYVVGADYDAPSQMPSLQGYFNHGRFSRKQALFGYLQSQGKDTKKLWKDVRQAIRETFIAKEKQMSEMMAQYKSTNNFFELVRFDFVIDSNMNLWLMEVNMSPNLSSAGHTENALMYEQVVYYALHLAGAGLLAAKAESEESEQMLVNDRDIMVESERCRKLGCLSFCGVECSLCVQCLSDDMKVHLNRAFLEHNSKGNYRRVLPVPKIEKEAMMKQDLKPSGVKNELLDRWYDRKCEQDIDWCY